MKLIGLVLTLFCLPSNLLADEAGEMIQVEACFIKCERSVMENVISKTFGATTNAPFGEKEKAAFLKELSAAKVDILASPRAIIRSGRSAVVQSGSEFRYPSRFEVDKTSGKTFPTEFETIQIGATFIVKQTVKGEQISAKITAKNVELKGYYVRPDGPETKEQPPKDSGPWTPVFTTSQIETEIGIASGKSCILDSIPIEAKISEESRGSCLYVLFSARVVSTQ